MEELENFQFGRRSSENKNGPQIIRFKPTNTGDHFVSLSSNTDYQLSANLVDDYINTQAHSPETPKGYLNSTLVTGAIETPGDRDRFSGQFFQYGKYEVSVEGFGSEPVSRPGLTLRDGQGKLIKSYGNKFLYSPGIGSPGVSSSGISFVNSHIDVRSNNANATGVYALRYRILDTANNESTKSRINIVNGTGEVRDALEYPGDVDFHRVTLKAKTWYDFEGQLFSLLDAGGNLRASGGGYCSESGGEFFAVSGKDRSYRFQINEGVQPTQRSTFDGQIDSRPLAIFQTNDASSRVEVYSEIPLSYPGEGGVLRDIPAKQLTTLSPGQLPTLVAQGDFSGVKEIFFRRVLPGKIKNGWSVAQVGNFRRVIDTDALSSNERTWAFATELPS